MTPGPDPATVGASVTPTRPSWVVIAPSYNHETALGKVLEELSRHHLPVVVINDGATDDTDAVLSRWLDATDSRSLRRILRHCVNQGKAAALRSGFDEAARLGFSHAATIDTDGQHEVADLLKLIEVSSKDPGALIVGARMRAGSDAPVVSRIGRMLSNALVWLESGVSVTDSQSGMRVYPLAHMKAITGCASRYGFETEVLVRAGWYGVAVVEKPIRCIYHVPGGRTTHFRLWGDTLAAIGMHTRLLGRAHVPGPAKKLSTSDQRIGTIPRRLGHWFSPRRLGRMASGDAVSRERLSASVGAGLLMATLPIYGVKTVACLWLSGRFRLHPLAVISISSLSTPPLGLLFAALSICVGGLLIHGQLPDLTALNLRQAARWSTVNQFIAEWLLGSVIAGVALGAMGYTVTRAMLGRPSRQPAPLVDQLGLEGGPPPARSLSQGL
ncbi:MAG: DUF2062 domain-containing protein [Phycisphaerales bacterium]|nr:DUF2062 domain-containing protein [Phycisphaerales bacterium]